MLGSAASATVASKQAALTCDFDAQLTMADDRESEAERKHLSGEIHEGVGFGGGRWHQRQITAAVGDGG
jgi:hypothetical protein